MDILRTFKPPTINPNVKPARNYWSGWCHSHVRLGFGAPSNYGSASDAWAHAERKHRDRNFPNADVPLFFSLRGVPAGHVVVRKANGQIITTGLNSTTKTFSSLDALLRAWPALNYLGWAEDINKTTIITGFAAAKSNPGGGIEVKTYRLQDAAAMAGKRTIAPGEHFYLSTDPKAGSASYSNVIGGQGYYVITAHVYAEGQPGDRVTVKYIRRYNPRKSNQKDSSHYPQSFMIPADGKLFENVTFQLTVVSKDPSDMRLIIVADDDNKGAVKVTRLDSDAALFIA